jgi:epoxyqueuosine reductase
VHPDTVKALARECGFELAGIAPAAPLEDDFARYRSWTGRGMAGEMRYLTDRRGDVRRDPRNLLPEARSIICVGKLYNQPAEPASEARAVISRYAWGRDYHDVMRAALERLARRLHEIEAHQYKICVDTAPILERSYARRAGLGWIGRNTCLINEPLGSWFFLGEIVTTLDLAPGVPPPDRCGTCTRCIEACPTQAIVPEGGGWTLDARRCIAYLNIELRGEIPEALRGSMGTRVFGCDICQEVCPWNSRAPLTSEPEFAPADDPAVPLEELASLSEEEFRARFGHTPVTRPKYDGFLRNVAVAMGATGDERYREALEQLSRHPSELVARHARWALEQIRACVPE